MITKERLIALFKACVNDPEMNSNIQFTSYWQHMSVSKIYLLSERERNRPYFSYEQKITSPEYRLYRVKFDKEPDLAFYYHQNKKNLLLENTVVYTGLFNRERKAVKETYDTGFVFFISCGSESVTISEKEAIELSDLVSTTMAAMRKKAVENEMEKRFNKYGI